MCIGAVAVLVFFALLYGWLLAWYCRQWYALPAFKVPTDFVPGARLTVVVAARNEASRLAKCLVHLCGQTYPQGLAEVIVVDDHSEDDTVTVAKQFEGRGVRVLELKDAPQMPGGGLRTSKKMALDWGIRYATGDYILTTDADCAVPDNWMRDMACAFEHKGWHCVAGPVVFEGASGLLQRFQALDFLGMMLITGAGFHGRLTHLANGASFGFSKKAFEAVGGYADNLHMASGDDLFLLHKIKEKFPVGFLKTPHAVRTQAHTSLEAFVWQRLRWGTKSRAYRDWRITLALAVVFFHSWGILLSIPAMLAFPGVFVPCFLVQLGIKSFSDYRMLKIAAGYFGKSPLMRVFWPAQGLHILYIAGIGLAANLSASYLWKGRKVR
jgi:cellulose synthase/poly-beta-1,6-N-acetylglucosamine synthase-like glycosyltransferase